MRILSRPCLVSTLRWWAFDKGKPSVLISYTIRPPSAASAGPICWASGSSRFYSLLRFCASQLPCCSWYPLRHSSPIRYHRLEFTKKQLAILRRKDGIYFTISEAIVLGYQRSMASSMEGLTHQRGARLIWFTWYSTTALLWGYSPTKKISNLDV